MPVTERECEQRWKIRLTRAQELDPKFPDSAGLALYQAVLQFQARVAVRSHATIKVDVPLRDQIEIAGLSADMRSILDISARHGPELLRSEAILVAAEGEPSFQRLLQASLSSASPKLKPVQDFFPRACLQPIAENLQVQLPKQAHYVGNICPACGGLPQAAILRPEGEGAGRSLLCSFCFCEWPYRRVICAWCGEEEKERLPRYSSDEWPHIHVEACETCKHYLKAVDLSVSGLAVPLVDEAAAAVLDVWADEHGYLKMMRNLIGF
jgi:formate dehydrogenase maturation protein FdhE